MENVQNTCLKWSALDVEAHIDNLKYQWEPGEAPTEFFDLGINSYNCEELEKMFLEEMKTIILNNQDNIIEYINNLVQDHVYSYQEQILDEITEIITPILQAKKTLQNNGK